MDDVRPLAGTTSPQGIVAEATPLPRLTLAELVAIDDPSAVLVLDRVEDPRNVGAAARSAVAAGVTAMVVARRRAAPLGAAAFKAAAGAFEDISIAVVSSIADAVGDLQQLGLWTVGLDSSGERSLFGLDLLGGPVAVVLGSEGRGSQQAGTGSRRRARTNPDQRQRREPQRVGCCNAGPFRVGQGPRADNLGASAGVAQSAEQPPCKRQVVGSIPAASSSRADQLF